MRKTTPRAFRGGGGQQPIVSHSSEGGVVLSCIRASEGIVVVSDGKLGGCGVNGGRPVSRLSEGGVVILTEGGGGQQSPSVSR